MTGWHWDALAQVGRFVEVLAVIAVAFAFAVSAADFFYHRGRR